jgi:ribosomal-protein-alanine N-acetyltransferase
MQASDLPQVYRLEVMSQPTPWPLWYFRRQLREGASCWVMVDGEAVIGFGIVAFVRDWAHIMNMCVAPEYRRRGLGWRIMLHLLGVVSQRRCRAVWLEVRPTNRPAIVLYRRLGFRIRQVRKGYYRNRIGPEDGLVMTRLIRSSIREKH